MIPLPAHRPSLLLHIHKCVRVRHAVSAMSTVKPVQIVLHCCQVLQLFEENAGEGAVHVIKRHIPAYQPSVNCFMATTRSRPASAQPKAKLKPYTLL
jgi:hypothetical protein